MGRDLVDFMPAHYVILQRNGVAYAPLSTAYQPRFVLLCDRCTDVSETTCSATLHKPRTPQILQLWYAI